MIISKTKTWSGQAKQTNYFRTRPTDQEFYKRIIFAYFQKLICGQVVALLGEAAGAMRATLESECRQRKELETIIDRLAQNLAATPNLQPEKDDA